jgi:hypothetical protein
MIILPTGKIVGNARKLRSSRRGSRGQSRQGTVGKKTGGSRGTGKTAAEGLALAQIVNKERREVGQGIEIIAAGILVNAVVTLEIDVTVTMVTAEGGAGMNATAREMKIAPTSGSRLLRDAL